VVAIEATTRREASSVLKVLVAKFKLKGGMAFFARPKNSSGMPPAPLRALIATTAYRTTKASFERKGHALTAQASSYAFGGSTVLEWLGAGCSSKASYRPVSVAGRYPAAGVPSTFAITVATADCLSNYYVDL
jgi:hypothetical protein